MSNRECPGCGAMHDKALALQAENERLRAERDSANFGKEEYKRYAETLELKLAALTGGEAPAPRPEIEVNGMVWVLK